EYVRWNTVRQYLKDIGFSQEVAKDDFIPENVFYRLAMKAKNETAEKFQAKVKATICPNCGYPVSEMNKSPETEANTNQDDTPQDINFSLELELEGFCSIKVSGKMIK